LLQELGTYFLRQLANAIRETDEKTEEAVALSFIAELPHNLRLTWPEPWPPEKIDELTMIAENSNQFVTV
jgi:hypothetical protein